MKNIRFLLLILLVGLMLACSLSVNVPEIRTGVTETKSIEESSSNNGNPVRVSLQMGAGTLDITPGAMKTIVGTVDYNVSDWEPKIVNSGDYIEISQSNTKSVGIPSGQIINSWDLQLGSEQMDLSISTGANEGTFDFSGLSLTRLSISDGASKTNVEFTKPNPVQMEKLEYHTGASEVKLFGLGFANVKDVEFYGGAGSYTLDFSGEVKTDMNVRISSGVSDVTLKFPTNTNVLVYINGGLSNINASGTWTINGNTYSSGNGQATITVNMDMAVGNLNLLQQ